MTYAEIVYDRIKAKTDAAALLEIGDDEIWVPLSLIDGRLVDVEDEENGIADIAEWFCLKEGLI